MKRSIVLVLLALLLFALPVQAADRILIFAPLTNSVIQQVNSQANVLVAGYYSGAQPFTVEYQLDGSSWIPLTSSTTSPYFQSTINGIARGQHTLILRVGGIQQSTMVGIGDVFIVGGQSNASGRGVNLQAVTNVNARVFSNSNAWQVLRDPVDSPTAQVDAVSLDSGARGTPWALLANMYSYPIAFIPCARGASSITQWQENTSRAALYGSCLFRYRLAGTQGARAMLWLQGETDAGNKMLAADYTQLMVAFADAWYSDTAVSIMAAYPHQMKESVAAFFWQWQILKGLHDAEMQSTAIMTGPDLTNMISDDAAGQHLTSNANLQIEALRWYHALEGP